MPVTIGALRESAPQETRVSLVPEVAEKLAKEGARVLLERGAGERARFPDALYKSVDLGRQRRAGARAKPTCCSPCSRSRWSRSRS